MKFTSKVKTTTTEAQGDVSAAVAAISTAQAAVQEAKAGIPAAYSCQNCFRQTEYQRLRIADYTGDVCRC